MFGRTTNTKAWLPCPDEVLHFPNNMSIEINYKNCITYTNCSSYDVSVTEKGFVWHQIAVRHKGKVHGRNSSQDILTAIFDAVEKEEIYPVAYRHDSKEDRFLVRQCKPALDKLFGKNLRIQLTNGRFLSLQIRFNVAQYKFGQVSPVTKMEQAVNRLYDSMVSLNDRCVILNLKRFSENEEFFDIFVNLGNHSVFRRLCETIYRNEEKFRICKGFILAENSISSLASMNVFNGAEFEHLDLRNNELRSAGNLCKDLRDIKANELFLFGNPLTKASDYPECLKPIIKNFKKIDGLPSENFLKDYTPIDKGVDLKFDGYRIDWSNKADITKFENSDDWHAVIISDPEEEYTKEQIFDYFFITVSPQCSDIYPCYYKLASGEHQFLVRHCYDQLKYLVDYCNLEIKVPRLHETTSASADNEETPTLSIENTLVYHLRMNLSPFKRGEIEPSIFIEKALDRRFSVMDRTLNLQNFQNIEGLENIVFNLSSIKILSRILMQASRKYLSNCVELCLANNKILNASVPKALSLMTNLKALDLSNNWLQDLIDIKNLQVLGLKSLRLDGNPLCSKYSSAGEYIKAVKEHFPELVQLDNVEVTTKNTLFTQKNFVCDLKAYDFVEQFVPSFFKTFETKERINLRELYHPHAIFTMTNCYMAAQSTPDNFKRIAKYADHARNIFKMPNFSRAHASVYVGAAEIMQVFMAMPSVTFDMLTFTTDATIFNDDMVVITVQGVYLDLAASMVDTDMLMAFARTLVLRPVARNQGFLECGVEYQIINDQLNIFNPTQAQIKTAFKFFKNDNQNLTNEELSTRDKEALLVMFQEVTNLKTVWCSRCLTDVDWDFEKALEHFLKLNNDNEVPDTAFI